MELIYDFTCIFLYFVNEKMIKSVKIFFFIFSKVYIEKILIKG